MDPFPINRTGSDLPAPPLKYGTVVHTTGRVYMHLVPSYLPRWRPIQYLSRLIYNKYRFVVCEQKSGAAISNVPDPWHFGVDPDPDQRIHASN